MWYRTPVARAGSVQEYTTDISWVKAIYGRAFWENMVLYDKCLFRVG